MIIITPQERGYKSDSTHVCFVDFNSAVQLADALGLRIAKQYSFPFPRAFGTVFTYNEFINVLTVD